MTEPGNASTRKRKRYPTTSEGNLFAIGVALSIFWVCGLLVLALCRVALLRQLLSMVTAHLISGRAGGISVGLETGMPTWEVIANATIIGPQNGDTTSCQVVCQNEKLLMSPNRLVTITGPRAGNQNRGGEGSTRFCRGLWRRSGAREYRQRSANRKLGQPTRRDCGK